MVVLAALGGFSSGGQAVEPASLDHHKAAVRRYVDSGEYAGEIAKVAAQSVVDAVVCVERRLAYARPARRKAARRLCSQSEY